MSRLRCRMRIPSALQYKRGKNTARALRANLLAIIPRQLSIMHVCITFHIMFIYLDISQHLGRCLT